MGPPAQMQKYKVQHGFIIHLINMQQNSFQRKNKEKESDLEEAKDHAAGALI